ncbi:hypothetical protein FRE64_08070 [Euhalothece natronophila Z-M001]|uniref:Uncharacterized protein n=1 Tax=Euhalothece natronophila Z-M001 TaxID=522448 RepID=A0A5B8NMY8_9CHRO|nr:hypothetical protein [Euhalothece natronophila]QDZ39901.1 hypothetical protein FRE64_08070 [Euhalothece natronophila Z-M001]
MKTQTFLKTIPLMSFSLIGILGLMGVLSTSSAQAGQARVTGASLVDDASTVSAVAGEAILSPGERFGDRPVLGVDTCNY